MMLEAYEAWARERECAACSMASKPDPRSSLSLVTIQIAVDRATQANTKEFAEFELEEAKTVTAVLKELGTPVPEMDAKAKATLEKIKSAAKGNAFDQAYIDAQLDNHEKLRDWATVVAVNRHA